MQKSLVLGNQTINNVRAIERKSANGRTLGTRIHFLGKLPAADIKKQLRAAKVPASEIREKVNAILTGKTDIAWVTYASLKAAEEQSVRARGGVPCHTDHDAKGTRSSTTYVFPVEAKGKAAKAIEAAPVDPEQVIADRMGIAVEDLRRMFTK
jgi:hypothetical protein